MTLDELSSDTMPPPSFLPGVPAEHVLQRLEDAGGDELLSGKFASPESSAALAVNCFGWFIPRPEQLPKLPGLDSTGAAALVDVEFCARFPWPGGRHPWLDAVVQTPTHLIGIESKRFEPFRDRKKISFSDAYGRDVWGKDMERYKAMREGLQARRKSFTHLDAAQLVKHAFGLVTTARRKELSPVLFYIFAEPVERAGSPIDPQAHRLHREELAQFADAVAGDEVTFRFAAYREWLAGWNAEDPDLVAHRSAVLERFAL